MSDELSAAERVVEEVLIDLMTERVMLMSTGIQAPSTRGLPDFSIHFLRSRTIPAIRRETN
jgi:hypothetical protein